MSRGERRLRRPIDTHPPKKSRENTSHLMWLWLEPAGAPFAPVRPILSGTDAVILLAPLVIPCLDLLATGSSPDPAEMCTANMIAPRLTALSRTAKGKTCTYVSSREVFVRIYARGEEG